MCFSKDYGKMYWKTTPDTFVQAKWCLKGSICPQKIDPCLYDCLPLLHMITLNLLSPTATMTRHYDLVSSYPNSLQANLLARLFTCPQA